GPAPAARTRSLDTHARRFNQLSFRKRTGRPRSHANILTESNVKTLAILSQVLLLGLGTFLMIVILLQRGRGGGLAGAFGGLGGQSAFGTKAGDVFTKITIGLAVAW